MTINAGGAGGENPEDDGDTGCVFVVSADGVETEPVFDSVVVRSESMRDAILTHAEFCDEDCAESGMDVSESAASLYAVSWPEHVGTELGSLRVERDLARRELELNNAVIGALSKKALSLTTELSEARVAVLGLSFMAWLLTACVGPTLPVQP